MANTIKLKRASGSDPGASDLSVGEIAIRTSNCKLFSKNDGGSAIGIVAGSADTLTTARTIAGVSFDGSGNISLNNNAITNGAGYIADVVSDTSPQLGGDLDVQSSKITTATSNGNVKIEPNGTGVVEVRGAGGNDGKLQLNCSAQSHGIKLASPAHSAGQSYTLIFPDNQIAADKYLKIKSISGSGSTAIGQAEYASLDANDLGEGTVPDARFPSTLPALNGSALTDLNGSNIASGTIAAARVATLNQNTTGSAATLTTARTIAGVSFDGSANISLNNNAITNGAGYITDLVNDTSPSLGGDLDCNDKNILLNDSSGSANNRIRLGASQDFALFHNGTINVIEAVSGDLHLRLNGSEEGIIAKQNGAVELYHNNVKRFDTTSSGVEVHGNLQMDDNDIAKFGTGGDLEILHDGSHSRIRDVGTGVLSLASNDLRIHNAGETEYMARFVEDGQVELYYDNNKKAETVSGGFTVTGTCTATAFAGDGSSLTGISAGATGGGSDEIFYENGQNVTTDYTITNGKNAMSAGPITIDSGVTVTVGAGETLTIV